MNIRRLTTSALLAAAALLLAVPPAGAASLSRACKPIAAKVSTFVAEPKLEVGSVAGLINGVIYLKYDDEAPAVDPTTSKANMVIHTKEGDLALWVYSPSTFEAPLTWTRRFEVLAAEGTGVFANTIMKLDIGGQLFTNKGVGEYGIIGSICPALPVNR